MFLDLSPLRSAVAALTTSIAVVNNQPWFGQQPIGVQQTLIAGVIQSFVFVYELSIRMLRRQLEVEAASPTEVDQSSFRDLLRMATAKGLIADPEAWLGHRHMRNITAHTYDQIKAQLVYQHALSFVKDAQALLHTLEQRNAPPTTASNSA
ncbi:MAG: hypothetical protein EI684_06550 [Candidatus Viridilinea halotolerans]|uniref:DUF86 domain-containing protein n=1 Tax=Candidatus Viridilinea halotolerans TaxID=2491704 RepID=A0A426U409_9CHLR|nr:MAG: hypothetical protein EI684_06550 [Candidatus Viridilinea halotolerans]